jgi:hypothetical protein
VPAATRTGSAARTGTSSGLPGTTTSTTAAASQSSGFQGIFEFAGNNSSSDGKRREMSGVPTQTKTTSEESMASQKSSVNRSLRWGQPTRNEIVEFRLMEGCSPRAQRRQLLRVGLDPDDIVANVRQARRDDRADIAAADDSHPFAHVMFPLLCCIEKHSNRLKNA